MKTTATAQIALGGHGCVVARVNAGAHQTMDDAHENLSACIAACNGRRRPLLIDITVCEPLQPDVRHFYSGEKLIEAFSALGLLVEASPFGRMMGNVYLRIARPGVPTRLFDTEAAAIAWLGGHL